MKHQLLGVLTAAVFVAATSSAYAATQNFSFTGNFSGDADVQLFNFTIGSTSNVTLRSYSYAGGTMADGTVISAGGFDPILALWDGAGNLIEDHDDGPDPVPADPVTGVHYDTNLTLLSLPAGSYTASIAQYHNFAAGTNLSDGFTKSNAFFTAAFGCSNGQFCDVTKDNRTSFWAFDVLGVDSAVAPPPTVTPLPASLPLMLTGLLGVGLVARHKKAAGAVK
jgi:hypothetical protein